MNMLIQIQPPNWADIMQGIGAIIGVPGAIAAFILLFLKDKNKQKQLDNLKEIAQNIEAQNETLKESNDLASQQIDVLRKMLLSPSTSGYNELAEIERKKLKLSIKPNLKSNHQQYRMEELLVHITNTGEDAIIDSVEFDEERFYHTNKLNAGYVLKKDQNIVLRFRTKDNANSNYTSYEIEVKFHDKLDNPYSFKINRDHIQQSFNTQQTEL